jgi:Flp pilus assembly protein TadG
LRGLGARLRGNCVGATAVFLALVLSGLIGLAGLGTEAASWYFTKRAMQGAADAGATTAAAALAAGAPSSTLATEAKSIAAGYKFVDGSHGTTVTVNYPPQSGTYQSSPAVEVLIAQPQNRLLSALFIQTGPTISTRAVALADYSKTGQACVVALDPANVTTVTTSGSTALDFPGCSLYVNSPSPSALTMNGGATIDASTAYFVGGVSGTGLTTATPNGIYTGVDPLIDPYLNAAVPPYSGCNSTNYKLTAGASDTKSVGSSGVYVCRLVRRLRILQGGDAARRLVADPRCRHLHHRPGSPGHRRRRDADRDERHDDHPDNQQPHQELRHHQDRRRRRPLDHRPHIGRAVGHRDLPGPPLHRPQRDQFADRRGHPEHRRRDLFPGRGRHLFGRQPDRRGGVHPIDRVDDRVQRRLDLQQ